MCVVDPLICIVETQLAKARVEGLAGSLGFDNSFAVAISGRSGGLCIFWKSTVNLAIIFFLSITLIHGFLNQAPSNGD